jgi:predicted component of type VI protein secretion system
MADLVLEMVEGKDLGRQYALSASLEVGREPGADGIRVDDEQVSRRHARVTPESDGALLEDLSSRNGTYVNGQVVGTAPRKLVPDDKIRMGLTVFQLRTQAEVARQPSAVGPAPQISQIGADVLRPASEQELRDLPPPQPDVLPGPRAPDDEPAFVPPAIMEQARSGGSRSDDLAAYVDRRVKRQTNVAAFAALAVAGLAVAIYFGIT